MYKKDTQQEWETLSDRVLWFNNTINQTDEWISHQTLALLVLSVISLGLDLAILAAVRIKCEIGARIEVSSFTKRVLSSYECVC